MTLTLREFKTRQLVMLKQLERELLQKYPDKADRIRYLVDLLESKLDHLRTFTLYDYLRTLSLTSREFKEFERLFPSEKEVRELLESKELG